jgi:hypothetical protein
VAVAVVVVLAVGMAVVVDSGKGGGSRGCNGSGGVGGEGGGGRPLLIRMKSESIRILICTKISKYQRMRSTRKCYLLMIKSIQNSYPTSIKTSMITCVNQINS